MRGEYIRGDGLILPNNVSLAGAEAVLQAAFQNAGLATYMALVQGAPTLDMTSGNLIEPSIGVGGYARVVIANTSVGWPVIGTSNSEKYVESLDCVFAAGDYDQSIQRLAILGTELYTSTDPIYSLSAPLPAEVRIQADTPLAERTFRYRFYL